MGETWPNKDKFRPPSHILVPEKRVHSEEATTRSTQLTADRYVSCYRSSLLLSCNLVVPLAEPRSLVVLTLMTNPGQRSQRKAG